MKYINTFNTEAQYGSAQLDYPNVSYVKETNTVKWKRDDATLIFAKYTTTSANQQVKITANQAFFSEIIIDGQQQTVGTGSLNHTFDSIGTYEVVFRLVNPSTLGNQMFYECSNLKSVKIPSSVTSIGNQVFYRCSMLNSVTLPNTITSIGNAAFRETSALRNITLPSSLTTLDTAAFYNSGLTEVTIPSSLTTWNYGIFNNCGSLETVVIENGVTVIGEAAFNACNSLTDVTIPSSVTTIGNNAFQGCGALEDITIPSSVTSIGGHCFYGDTALETVNCNSTTPPTLGDERVFQYGDYGHWQNLDCTIYVPSASVSAYQSANNWTGYSSMIQAAS